MAESGAGERHGKPTPIPPAPAQAPRGAAQKSLTQLAALLAEDQRALIGRLEAMAGRRQRLVQRAARLAAQRAAAARELDALVAEQEHGLADLAALVAQQKAVAKELGRQRRAQPTGGAAAPAPAERTRLRTAG
jgi:hypothetical protein